MVKLLDSRGTILPVDWMQMVIALCGETAKKRYSRGYCYRQRADIDEDTDLPLGVVVTIPAIGPNDPSDTTG